jgi:RecB family exonuclease
MASGEAAMQGIRDIEDWVDAVCAMPRMELLSQRVVVVPNGRVAHALRRRLAERGDHHVLAGTLFAHVATLAAETLALAGIAYRAGEESLRRPRIAALLEHPLPLRYFDQMFLRTTPGWARALARSIDDLEGAGVSPPQLAAQGGAAADVAAIWTELIASCQGSWTMQRILAEAADCLERSPAQWQLGAHTLAAVTGHESAAQARFLRAIPNVRVVPVFARPLRAAHMARVARLFGDATRDALAATHARDAHATDRDRLALRFLEPPSVDRPDTGSTPGAPQRDGTAELEEYAGLEAEIEAAVDWVTREVMEHQTPLGELAILMPRPDPYTSLLIERLARLPWLDLDAPAVVVANGVPVASHVDGTRLLSLIRALRDSLHIDSLAELVPCLRLEGGVRLGQDAAVELLQRLGTLGGSPADPYRSVEWASRAEARAQAIAAHLKLHASLTDEDSGVYERDAQRRLAERIAAVLPGLRGLCGLAERVLQPAPFSELWPAVLAFAETHLRMTQGSRMLHLLNRVLSPLCEAAPIGGRHGQDALALIESTLHTLRIPLGRYGEPLLYIGTVQSAVGLPFTSIRVLGLSEGQIPSSPREDPVLPDLLRASVDPNLPQSSDTINRQLHALDRVVRGSARRVAFSSPRLGAERSNREPSAMFVEAAVAIDRTTAVPSREVLEGTYFAPARRGLREHRLRTPLLCSARLERQALLGQLEASTALPHSALSPTRMRRLMDATEPGPFDGLLGADLPIERIPGLHPLRPISASRLKALLECPFRFMLNSLLGFREPADPADFTQFDARTYGSLMHRVVEEFSKLHGKSFAARGKSLEDFRVLASEIAVEELRLLLEEYPLGSGSSVEQQRKRLLRDLSRFLEYDWDEGRPGTFVAAEKEFGWAAPFAIDVAGEPLYLRGAIDRLDIRDGRTLLRDLKTGKHKPRNPGDAPDPTEDIQIGLYGLVAQAHAATWSLPHELDAAYVYPRASTDPERAFSREEYQLLEAKTRQWLAVAAGLLRARAFPRTPRERDCQFCKFKPVCGPDAPERAKQVIDERPQVLAAFGELKGDTS